MRSRANYQIYAIAIFLWLACAAWAQSPWPPKKANAWYAQHGWLVGCNYIPSSAINELEMWQAETFDPATIDRELGWAEQIGFNEVRVFLQNLVLEKDGDGFLMRMDHFLRIAHRHRIGVTFVLFDSCWNPYPKLGQQPRPTPYRHNSGWVQCPGEPMLEHPKEFATRLKPYVQRVIGYFRKDNRVDMWDLYNEPDNMNDPAYIREEPADKKSMAVILLQESFEWARELNPSQPLTSGVWRGNWADTNKYSATERVQLQNSDVITFHNYGPLDDLRTCVGHLRRYERPIICTEYMARPVGSTFDPNLKFMRDQNVGACCWGFVSGKTQTIYPWDSWRKDYTAEPPVWFHDIFRADGTPYDANEVAFIKSVTLR